MTAAGTVIYDNSCRYLGATLNYPCGSAADEIVSEQRMTFSDAFFFCQPGGRECAATSLDEFSPAT